MQVTVQGVVLTMHPEPTNETYLVFEDLKKEIGVNMDAITHADLLKIRSSSIGSVGFWRTIFEGDVEKVNWDQVGHFTAAGWLKTFFTGGAYHRNGSAPS